MRIVLVWAARLLVGVLFLVSGLIKANDLTGFVYKLEEYLHVFAGFTPGFLQLLPYAVHLATFITLLELALAVLLLLGLWRGLTIWLLLLLILLFTALTGFSAITNSVTDCGCFGEVLKLTPWESFIKDIVLTVLIGFLYVYKDDIRPVLRTTGRRVATFAATMLIFGLLTWYAYNHLPIVDFTAYAPGQDLAYNSTNRNAAGQIIAKDYQSWGRSCTPPGNELTGTALLIVISKTPVTAADSAALQYTGELARGLQDKMQVYAGTSMLSDDRVALAKALNLPYCLSVQDATMLKTMIRSSPGYVLLKNGVVVRKWHHNDAPSAQDLMEHKP